MNKMTLAVTKLANARFNAAVNVGMVLANRRTYGHATLWSFFPSQVEARS